jgi:hypothetical protein
MTDKKRDSGIEAIKDFMAKNGWQEHCCSECNRTFFAKPLTRLSTTTCGWHGCGNAANLFLDLSKRKRLLKPSQIKDQIAAYFRSTGFDSVAAINIATDHGKTDLIGAGVQLFDPILHQGNRLRTNKVFIAQPCVRMQFQPMVEEQEGTSTSFVNVCTEQMSAGLDNHLKSVDLWLTILSQLGLHMDDFIIVMRNAKKNWGTGEFSGLELFFTYGGLELGDASYIQVPQDKRPPIPISDIGFGLERLAWAINKTESYFDTLKPWTTLGDREMFDCCRTLALLALCGVRANNKGAGLQFRRMAKILGNTYYSASIFDILPYYFDYWSQFITPSTERSEAIHFARLEIERFVNLKIAKMLNLPSPREETTDAYFDRLVYTCNISIDRLHKAIQVCKKQ